LDKARTLIRAVAILFVLVLSSAAHGGIYGWTDSEGTAHFTNRESNIPSRYRSKAKLLYPEPTDSQAPQQAGQPQISPQATARPMEPPASVAQPAANPERQNARKVPGFKRSLGRHLKPRDATEEE